MPISIGPITINDPVFLAPMSGVSDLPFRRMVKRFGAGLVFSEMIASRAMLEEARRETLRPADYEAEFPMAVQLAGCEPELVAQAAQLNVDRGAAIIDINFGCPVKKVVKNFAGSALMRDEALATRIMAQTVRAVNVPVTVKMRLGWDDTSINAPKLAKIAQDVGVQMITVHGRTREQLYSGTANWAAIRAVREAITIPLIVNGDIDGPEAAREALTQSGADGVMIGRATYGRPWLVQQTIDALQGKTPLAAPCEHSLRDIILEHYEAILTHYGTTTGVGIARKHIGWYYTGLEQSNLFRNHINQLQDPALVRAAITEFFDNTGFLRPAA